MSRVIVRIIEWGKNKKPQGEVLQIMDEADENDRAMKEILLENGFRDYFPRRSDWKNPTACRKSFPSGNRRKKGFQESIDIYD